MLSRWMLSGLGAAVMSGLCFTGVWRAVAEAPPASEPQPAAVPAITTELGGPDRYLTQLSTDKPLYKPGEKAHFRAVVLHHATRVPMADGQPAIHFEVRGPKGETVGGGDVPPQDGIAGFSWEVPATLAGGEYTLKATHPFTGQAAAERKFDIRAYRAPRLKSQIKFIRDGYGPGDEVAATLKTERAEGGIPANAPVTIVARVDGDEVFRGQTTVDAQGNATAKFTLPGEIRRGEGSLALIIDDSGIVETASKTIPILLQTVDLNMYPEGGELVAGLPNRVYFEAFTPAKKPADLAGEILDGEGKSVAKFKSAHEGRGKFDFTPAAGGKYTLKITEPSGIKSQYPLPEVKGEGAVIQAKNEVFAAGKPIELAIGSAKGEEVKVVITQRETELASTTVKTKAGELANAKLDIPANAAGVLIATVWAGDKPVAERLIFRQPAEAVNIKISADQKQYNPGGKAKITVTTTNAKGEPVSSVVGLSVTDDSVLEMIEKRDQPARLPVMVFFEGEVRELSDAHVYLDPANKDADKAVDLLLGTQGWRRFMLVDRAKFLETHADKGRRALALRLPTRHELRAFAEDRAKKDGGVLQGKFGGFPPAPGAPAPRAAAAPADDFAPAEGADARDLAEPAPQKAPAPAPVPPAAEPARPAIAGPALKPNANAERVAGGGARAGGGGGFEFRGDEQLDQNRRQLQDRLEKAEEGKEENALFAKRLRANMPAARNDFVVVRQFAHEVRSDRKPGERKDFAETLFWHAGLKTDAKTGEATFEFGLSDSVTSFRIFADAFTSTGALGATSQQIDSVEPFYLEPKLPLEVTQGDYIRVPVGIVNATPGKMDAVKLTVDTHASQKLDTQESNFALTAGQRTRTLHGVRIGKFHGDVEITYAASAGSYSDKVTRKFTVKPLGFPIEWAKGGLVAPGETISHEVNLPADLVKGSVKAKLQVFPTPLGSLTSALERLIQEPCGCFEQTSSSVYPLVMAQQYFKSHQGVDPSLISRSTDILSRGYDRLTSFECKGGGYEWFGNDPGHDALTAYGLLEFTDMSQVRDVDAAMLKRTREWLMAQRDGKGGFARKTHTLHTWLAEPEIANSYNTWALLEAGIGDGLMTESTWVADAAEKTNNTYVLALGLNVAQLGGNKDAATRLLDKLAGLQQEDGSLKGSTTSVVGSGGDALTIETTALAMLAWLREPKYAAQVEKSRGFLAEACKAGRFGSTQSTILALRAIMAYDKSRAKPKSPGSLQLVIDDQPVGEPVAFTKDTEGAIDMPAFADKLSAGQHKIQVKMTDGSEMPYALSVNYFSLTPETSKECKLHLETKLKNVKVDEGSVTEVAVAVINRSNEVVPNPVALIGIPGGLEVRHDQLKELVKAGTIAAYEVIGRDVVLYWRSLDKEQRIDLPLSCVAAIPGTYTAPASRAYLYYTDEHKHWTPGLKIEVTPKE